MTNLVLVLNCGSSSVKFSVVNPKSGAKPYVGQVQCIATKEAKLAWQYQDQHQHKNLPSISYQQALNIILQQIKEQQEISQDIIAVGHRVVHGAEHFTASVIIDAEVLRIIKNCQNLAPLHNPANIQGIEAAGQIFPNLKQVAVFDTAFHHTIPPYAYLYAIPYELYQKFNIRKFGFHGTSHSYVAKRAIEILGLSFNNSALITAHLGNGCSISAILNGKSIDTSMGFTPLEGLVMGTRSGDIDPGLPAYLADIMNYDVHEINELLNKKSGLLGISGIDADMRNIEFAAQQGDEKAKLAIEIFCYRLAKYIGAYAVILGKINALVFTGGIGENSSLIRARTIEWLKLLNFTLDVEANEKHGLPNNGIITTPKGSVAIVVPTNEELLIAQDVFALCRENK